MSTSIARDIQRLASLDGPSTRLLRTFDLEWHCGTRFIKAMLLAGCDSQVVGGALQEILPHYRRLCRLGVADFERLESVLGHLYRALKGAGQRPDAALTAQWGRQAYVPEEILEYLHDV